MLTPIAIHNGLDYRGDDRFYNGKFSTWGGCIGRDLIACQSFVSEGPRTHGLLHYEAMCYARMCTLMFRFIIPRVDSKRLNAFSIAKEMQKSPRPRSFPCCCYTIRYIKCPVSKIISKLLMLPYFKRKFLSLHHANLYFLKSNYLLPLHTLHQ